MKNQVIKILEVTPDYYDEIVLHTYVDWCMGFNPQQVALQRALLDKKLFNYYMRQLTQFEKQFVNDMVGCELLSKADKHEYYALVTGKLFNHYPGAFKQRVKKKDNIKQFN